MRVQVRLYFDETGQSLSRVLTDGDPTGSPNRWVTRVVRDADGLVDAVNEPDNVTGYTHSTGAITVSSTVGRVRAFDRETSGDMTGLVTGWRHRNAGTGGSAYLDRSQTLVAATLAVGDVTLSRPVPSGTRIYPDTITTGTSGSIETTIAYSWHSGAGALRPKSITTTHPAVATGKNGENATHTSAMYLRSDGTAAFQRNLDGVHTYQQYVGGRLVKTILDAQTNHGSDFAAGDDPSTDFGITETGDGLRLITTHTYDPQGRPDATTGSDGRISKRYYSRLQDQRLVTLAYADYETSPSTRFYGPVAYVVMNQARVPEAQATVSLSGGSTTTASSGHVDETSADVKAAMLIGSLARLSTTVLDETGRQSEESRVYFSIPSSLPGTEGTHYDATRFGYDASGRRWRVKAPDGTITRTIFDGIGRSVSTWIGLNDNDGLFPGGEISGTSDMVKLSEVEYDGGSDNGPSRVTKRTLFVEDSTTDKRETTYQYDTDHRLIVQVNPLPPHVVHRYDHMGRSIATGLYSSSSGLAPSTDPTASTSTNRVALSERAYDERGRVWKSTRWEVDASTGNKGSSLDSLTWFDRAGRTIKADGEQLAKTSYDRLGRQIRQYVLASTNDSAYADALTVTGDIVLEEHVTAYDPTDQNVVLQASIARFHDDFGGGGTTGALDTNADGDELLLTAANLEGRVRIAAMWYDRFGRVTDTALYGTNGGSNFDRDGLSVPTRSDTVLVTSSTYGDDGSLTETTDPRGLVTRQQYDAAGRTVATIANYVNGAPSSATADDDQILRFVYQNGHRTKYWVDIYPVDTDGTPDSEDQVTTYTYGVVKGTSAGDSKIASGSLLQKVQYPDSSGGADVVTYAYSAQSQEIWRKDQEGNVLESDYDTAGRRTHHRVTTLAGGFDASVLRISTTYDASGRTSLITSHDHATPGSGSVVNEVKQSYDGWGNLATFQTDPDSAVGGSGYHEVAHAYATATSGRNTLRRTTTTQPGGALITYNYSSTGSLPDANASRVSSISLKIGVGTNVRVAEYSYNGVGDVVGREYPEADVFWRQFGSTSGDYPDRDRFDRIIRSRWTKDLATDLDFVAFEIGYDRNSNITSTEDLVYSAGFDVKYAIDNLNRLTDADEGTLASGSITTRTRRQQWLLDQVGNWENDQLDLDGDGVLTGTGELDEVRTHNLANEILTREPDGSSPPLFTLTHDDTGNLTDDGEDYTFEYDAWYRLRKMRSRSSGDLVAVHTYFGNGFRASEQYDTNLDGDVDGSDQTYVFAYDERWRIVATFRGSDSDPKERFVHDAAGASGLGGSSYIDDVVLRDRDANTAWTSASDGTLEERRYYCQNWRHDVVALVTDAGELAERVRYSAYGVPFGMPLGDVNGDGTVNGGDSGDVLGSYGATTSGTVRYDLNLDGTVDASDSTIVTGNWATTLGRGALSAIGNRRGYAGYEADFVVDTLMHVRHRVYDGELGRWTRRNPSRAAGNRTLLAYQSLSPFGSEDAGHYTMMMQVSSAAQPKIVRISVRESPDTCSPAFGECEYRFGVRNVPADCTPVLIQKVINKWYCGCCSGSNCNYGDQEESDPYWEVFPLEWSALLKAHVTGIDKAWIKQSSACVDGSQRGDLALYCAEDLVAENGRSPIDGWAAPVQVAFKGGCEGVTGSGELKGTLTDPGFPPPRATASRLMRFQAWCCGSDRRVETECKD